MNTSNDNQNNSVNPPETIATQTQTNGSVNPPTNNSSSTGIPQNNAGSTDNINTQIPQPPAPVEQTASAVQPSANTAQNNYQTVPAEYASSYFSQGPVNNKPTVPTPNNYPTIPAPSPQFSNNSYSANQFLNNENAENMQKFQSAAEDRNKLNTKRNFQLPKSNHNAFIFGGLILSVALVLIAMTVASGRLSLFGRASESSKPIGAGELSIENSYVFASPTQAQADGKAKIRVTVYLLNSQGTYVEKQQVNLKSSGNTNITPVQPQSDNMGRAIFDVTSQTPGDYILNAEVSNAALPQKVSISFR